MLARIFSCGVIGLEGVVIEVEVDTSNGQPKVLIVGLLDAAVQESRERVQSAIKNNGFFFPRKRVTVNLAPADVRKEGPAYDLPIAVGILAASGQIKPQLLEKNISCWGTFFGRNIKTCSRGSANGGFGSGAGFQALNCS